MLTWKPTNYVSTFFNSVSLMFVDCMSWLFQFVKCITERIFLCCSDIHWQILECIFTDLHGKVWLYVYSFLVLDNFQSFSFLGCSWVGWKNGDKDYRSPPSNIWSCGSIFYCQWSCVCWASSWLVSERPGSRVARHNRRASTGWSIHSPNFCPSKIRGCQWDAPTCRFNIVSGDSINWCIFFLKKIGFDLLTILIAISWTSTISLLHYDI